MISNAPENSELHVYRADGYEVFTGAPMFIELLIV